MDLPSKADLDESSTIFEDYEPISISQTPTQLRWALHPMYKDSQTEGILYWRVGFDGSTDELVTEHGYHITSTGKKGKWQVDRLKLYINNLHKSILPKALQDATRAYQDKFKEGYSDETGKSIDLVGAQLANKYPLPGQSGTNPLKKYNFKRGLSLQAKLDGIRARVWRINGEIKIYSRENNPHPWLDTYIRPEIDTLLNYLPSGAGLDCELYNPAMSFNEVTSAVKTYKTKHPKNDNLFLYIFDLIVLNTSFDRRIELLRNAYAESTSHHIFKRLVILDHTVIHNETLIKLYHDEFVKLGYEGMIMRRLLGPSYKMSKEQLEAKEMELESDLSKQGYKGVSLKSSVSNKMKELGLSLTQKEIEETWYKPGRNNNLLKVKSFIDEEATVIDIIQGEGRETELAILVVEDIRKNRFSVRPRGSFEDRKMWLEHKKLFINKRYTIRYFELTEYGVPRFPVGVAFRDYE